MKTAKIIRLSNNPLHYIIVDNSEIKKPFDGYCLDDEGNIRHGRSDLHTLSLSKKITHSTQSLDDKPIYSNFKEWIKHQYKEDLEELEIEFGFYGHDIGTTEQEFEEMYNNKGFVKLISVSEIEELIYGYSVEKMAHNAIINHLTNNNPDGDFKHSTIGAEDNKNWWINGFNAHKELVKDKLFTIEDMEKAYDEGYSTEGEVKFEKFIQSLLSTEWDCTIDDEGKITLVK